MERQDDMVKVVLDTDIGNEIDDMFALVYFLSSEELELKALTIEPFSKSVLYPDVSLTEANRISFDFSMKILDLAGRKNLQNRVFVGADRYYYEKPDATNPAVEKMAEILKNFPDTVIASIGAPINVALLFRNYPELAEKTKVIWLGGNGLGYKTNVEYNFCQDPKAVAKLFTSCRNLTVIPCKNIASNLVCTENDVRQFFSGSPLGDFLISRYMLLKKVVCNGEKMFWYAKTLWDIAVIACLIERKWFEFDRKIGVDIGNNQEYIFGTGNNAVDFVVDVNRNFIMNDFYKKTVSLCFSE